MATHLTINSNGVADTERPEDTEGGSCGDTQESRLSDVAYDRLITMIVAGELKPGRAVSESQLSRHLKISRTPVHEAICRLAKDGLMIQQRNRRPVVAVFTREEIFDVFEMRRILEGEAARKCAVRMSAETLDTLMALISDYEHARSPMVLSDEAVLSLWAEHDDRFHQTIALGSGSRRLVEEIARYRFYLHAFNQTHSDVALLEVPFEEHRQIVEAIAKRNPDQARAAMDQHVSRWQAFFTARSENP